MTTLEGGRERVMKNDLGDHIGKKRGWFLFELIEVVKLLIQNPQIIKDLLKNKKEEK